MRIELNPKDTLLLGRELFKVERFEEAAAAFQATAETEPENWEAAYQTAFTFSAMKRYEDALPWYERAMAIVVTQANMVCLNRSVVLGEMGRSEEAANMLVGLLQRQPDHPHALYNLGVLRMQMDDFEGALPLFERSLELDPDCANGDARFCRGFANLVLGNYASGFKDFEHRLKDNVAGRIQGEELRPEHVVADKTVLVLSEMGRGDMIQFGRYIPMLKERGAKVTVVADRGTEPLFRDLGVNVISPNDPMPVTDYWCHMMGLAHVFGTDIGTVPAPTPLTYDEMLLASWRLRIPRTYFNVGLCWAGSPESRYDEHRSIPLELLKPLTDMAEGREVRFYGLQQDIRETDRKASGRLPIRHVGHEFRDFKDTAHAMKCLDLVITVDTSVAHLAGTVGTPTLVLLTKFRTYWLWLQGHTTTPWYPSFTLLRQKTHGDWASVIENVRERLARVVAAK